MSWQFFEPMDLFGEGQGAPVKVYRSAFADYDQDPSHFARYLELDHLTAFMGGKAYKVPRLEGWWGACPYAFGGRVVAPRPNMPGDLLDLLNLVHSFTPHRFDSCFVNYYRDGNDHIPWHADDEPWIGPVVASVSMGATRRFWLRRKNDHKVVVKGSLQHGDLLLMEAGCQDEWEHRVPKEQTKVTKPRLNFTFRQTRTEVA